MNSADVISELQSNSRMDWERKSDILDYVESNLLKSKLSSAHLKKMEIILQLINKKMNYSFLKLTWNYLYFIINGNPLYLTKAIAMCEINERETSWCFYRIISMDLEFSKLSQTDKQKIDTLIRKNDFLSDAVRVELITELGTNNTEAK